MSADMEMITTPHRVPAALLRPAPFQLRGWLIAWGLGLALLLVLLANNAALDTWAWRGARWAMGNQFERGYVAANALAAAQADPAAYAFEKTPPPINGMLYKRTETLWRVLRALGEPWMVLILAAVAWLYHAKTWRAAGGLVIAAALSGGIVSLLSATLGRMRPTGEIAAGVRNTGDNLWTLFRGFSGAGDLSFPSGHATLAFALAGILAYMSPRGKWLFLVLAAGCALSRVVMHAHFFSDIIAGALAGYALGYGLILALDRLEQRLPTGWHLR